MSNTFRNMAHLSADIVQLLTKKMSIRQLMNYLKKKINQLKAKDYQFITLKIISNCLDNFHKFDQMKDVILKINFMLAKKNLNSLERENIFKGLIKNEDFEKEREGIIDNYKNNEKQKQIGTVQNEKNFTLIQQNLNQDKLDGKKSEQNYILK